ncbi:hypothetical protein [Parasitella parasitica]|uniref:Hyphally-regulated cell wall protein N-terminal domain-containing protein n=1 Tax=Parasitella parasitica TaxID=35722 RepID=A0A0B7MPR1_9FUNG|nr:hypothetical protein [Parasitella parasitica]
MKFIKLVLAVIALLAVHESLAWDNFWTKKSHWRGWFNSQSQYRHKIDHHKNQLHHKHHRHHRHRQQICETVSKTAIGNSLGSTGSVRSTTTAGTSTKTTGAIATPTAIEDTSYFPNNLAGNLTRVGFNCSSSRTTQVYQRFNGVFFGDFITSEAEDILGPLAVRGAFSAHAYTVNSNHGANCSDVENSMSGYGLVLGTSGSDYKYSDIHVHGATFLPAGADVSNIVPQDSGCSVYNDRGTGYFNFTQVELNAIAASQQFSVLPPTLHLDSEGVLTRLDDSAIDYDVITFGTCSNCTYNSNFSSPDAIYFGRGNWNGPVGMSWPPQLIINIPVLVDTAITIQGNLPSQNMSVCSTILNLYPADNEGHYSSGSFQLNRNTGGQLGGMTLMPEGDIEDSGTGAFAGQVFANNYHWSGSGVELHDYQAIGGSCLTIDTCIPIFVDDFVHEIPPPPYYNSESVNSMSSSASSSSDESNSSSSEVSSSNSSEDSSSSSEDSSSSSENSSSSSEDSSSSSEDSSSSSEDSSSRDESSNSSEETSSSSSSEESSSSSSSEESSSSSSSEESSSSSSEESNSSSVESNSSSVESNSSSVESSSSSVESSSNSVEISSSSVESSSSEESSISTESSSSSSSISSDISSSSITSNTEKSSIDTESSSSSEDLSSNDSSESNGSQIQHSAECHTHHHHETTTKYQCDQGYDHDEEILFCEDDSHHHHRKEYYLGNDDDNFENDVEFGLYDYNQFDEECDIDHQNGYNDEFEQDDGDYIYNKHKGRKHEENDDKEDDYEYEAEDDDDNEYNEDDEY